MSATETAGAAMPTWSLGERMRKAREFAGVAIEDMAADIGRTERTIRNYESDATTAPFLVIKQYALRCVVPIDWITATASDCYQVPYWATELTG